MTPDLDGLHFKASSYCALCRERLPEPQYDLEFEPPISEAWEYKVLAICDASSTDMPFGIVALRADLTDPDAFSKLPVVTISHRTSLQMNVCLSSECGRCKADKIAHLVHLDCWKLINKMSHPCITSIYKLAQSTYPLFENGQIVEGQDGITIDFMDVVGNDSITTEVGRLLGSLSCLPLEIQLAISARCGRDLLSSLLTVFKKSSALLDVISHGDLKECNFDLLCNPTVESLSTRLLNVYGRRYISLLRYNETGGDDAKEGCSISVKGSRIKGLKFVLDVCGICAVSILYTDDSASAWLGDERDGWKGVIYRDNLGSLRVIKDDLKYLRIDLVEKTKSITMPKDLVMWDKDFHFSDTLSYQILESANPRPQIRGFPGWRLCRYLPLIDGKGYITGLTMYCDGHSVTGIIAHGESSRLIGNRQGCPIHLYLQKNERIVSMWIRTPHDSIPTSFEAEPTILVCHILSSMRSHHSHRQVTTSHRRSCIFGPYVPQHYSQLRQYSWTNLSKYPGSDILGIFYDALLVSARRQIITIGITQVVKPDNDLIAEDLPRIPIAYQMPSMSGTVSVNSFISIGTFSQVQRLEVCRLGTRCAGISIWHNKDAIEVLGQWDPTQTSTISEIYNYDEGILTSITFRFSISKSYIEDISVGTDNTEHAENEHSKVFHIKQLNQPVAWWFTRSHDHVEVWNGTREQIAVSARKCRVMDMR